MSRNLKRRLAISVASVLTALSPVLWSGAPARAAAPSDVSVGDLLALTVYLPVRNEAAAEAAARAIQTPGSSTYHQFLGVPQFVARYGATDNQIANVEAILEGLGFTIEYVYPNHLAVEAVSLAGTAQSALGLKLKRFTVNGRSGIASTTPMRMPAALAGLVRGIGGFDTVTHPAPRHVVDALGVAAAPQAVAGKLVGGTPGNYLPADFEKFYDVTPLSQLGITGRGSTIGIVTLNDFKTSDAYLFWKQIGLNVSSSRITKVNVDGGETASSNNADGEGETDLDVEESGSIAPDAKVRVYIAPNISNANFINGFEAAASENIADTISSSWGQPELEFFYNQATQTTGDSFLLEAFHDAFLEMALQGQTVFIAAGDSGSFDTVRDICSPFGTPSPSTPVCSAPFSVDHPSSDPLVTAAGGTTLPFKMKLKDGILLTVAKEQAWGWDYISSEAAAQGKGSVISVPDVFSTGGGGGVSSYWARPWYQADTKGITVTKSDQNLTENTGSGNVVQYVLPAKFAGRNLPDISTNADPESGYQYIEEGTVSNFYGGTSFVAPQLNGVNALFVQALGGRVGQISPAVYQLGSLATPDITAGDNWGYKAIAGYDNAAGAGTLDATRLLIGLLSLQVGLR